MNRLMGAVLVAASCSAFAQSDSAPKIGAFDYDVSHSAWGFPDRVQDWGGGRQDWIYSNGRRLSFEGRYLVSIQNPDGWPVKRDVVSAPESNDSTQRTDQSMSSSAPAKAKDEYEPTPAQVKAWSKETMKKGKDAVIYRLKDPDSVKFRNLFVGYRGLVLCGEVNAKNSMGGYTGFQRFYTFSGKTVSFEGDKAFELDWLSFCKK